MCVYDCICVCVYMIVYGSYSDVGGGGGGYCGGGDNGDGGGGDGGVS